MQLFIHLQAAVCSYGEALTLIRQKKLGRLLFGSCVLYLLLILLSAWLLWLGMDAVADAVLNWSVLASLKSKLMRYPWIWKLSKFGLYLSSLFVFLSVYKYLFLALASPLYAYLSERTAEALQGISSPFRWSHFLHDMARGILISLRNMLRQLLLNSVFYLLSFLPLIGWLFGLLVLANDWYYYGFSMLDYNCERERMSIRESQRFIRSHKGLAIGNGLILFLAMLLPVFGIMLAAPLSAMAATISFYRHSSFSLPVSKSPSL